MNLMLIVLLLVIGKASCEITSFHTKYSLRCDNPKEGKTQTFASDSKISVPISRLVKIQNS